MKRIVLVIFGLVILFLVVMLVFSTSNKVDKIVLTVNRFEHDLFSVNPQNIIEKLNKWDQDFGSFNEIFATQIIQIPYKNKDQYCNSLIAFVQNKDMREAYDSTALVFSDFSDIHHDLERAFSRFVIAFPSYSLPKITTFFGGFNYGVVTYDGNIGIGLENFLGKKSKFYQYLGDPEYLRFQKQKKFILSNVMEVWFNEYFQKYLGGRDLLSQMIYKGKMMCFLDKMLPELPLEDKFRFTLEQMSWVEENEASIWQYFIHEDLLFSKKESDFRSYLSYAPFAKGMPKEAPARVAYYIGYSMVNEYLQHNKVEIEEAIFLTDSRDFLRKSRYKPNK